jgi:hypothetical protein
VTARQFALAFATVTAAALVFPARAEAAPRRFFWSSPTRGGTSVTRQTPVKSDEAVQAVISRTPAGGIADLPQGTFRTSVVIDRPMTLRANVRGTTFDGQGLGVPVVTVVPGVAGVAIEGLRVQNGTVEGILAGAGADSLRLLRVTVADCGGDGIRLGGVAGARLDLCVLDGNAGDGLDAGGTGLGADRVTARGNTRAAVRVLGTGAHVTELLAVGGAEGLVFAGGDGLAERCRFSGVGTAVRFADGSWGNRLAIADVAGGRTGVEAEAGSASCTVAGVVVHDVDGDGIRLCGASHLASGCTVTGLTGDGIVLSGASSRAASCTVRQVAGEGLRLEGDDHTADGNGVTRAAAEGIHVVGGRGNRVLGNVILQCGGEGIADEGIDTQMSRNRID